MGTALYTSRTLHTSAMLAPSQPIYIYRSTIDLLSIYYRYTIIIMYQSIYRFLPPLLLMATALINGTHGLGFAHKFALMGIVLLDTCLLLIVICSNNSATVIACADTYGPEPSPPYCVRTRGSGQLAPGASSTVRTSSTCTSPGRTASAYCVLTSYRGTTQVIALCQAGAVVVGAAVAHL